MRNAHSLFQAQWRKMCEEKSQSKEDLDGCIAYYDSNLDQTVSIIVQSFRVKEGLSSVLIWAIASWKTCNLALPWLKNPVQYNELHFGKHLQNERH